MSDWQKAADRLHDAATKYSEAIKAEKEAFREWIDAGNAMDRLEGLPDPVSAPGDPS